MIYRTKDAILKHVPKLNKEDLAGINRAFIPYLFYREHRDVGFRECWCTSCREHFAYAYTQRTMDDRHREFLAKHHNEWSVCPKCGRHVKMKETVRAKSCKSLKEWKRIVIVKPVKDAVYLLALYAVKDYQRAATRGGYNLIEPEKSEAAVYYLAPGYAREFKVAFDYTYLGLRSGDYYEPKRITEPFTKTVYYNYAAPDKRGYDWIGFDRMEKMFLRYAPIRLFERAYETWWYSNSFGYGVGECPDVKFLAYCALYPSVERLLKLESGLSDFVCELIENKPMKRYIDWMSPTPKEMLSEGTFDGMSVSEIRELVKKAKDQGEQISLLQEQLEEAKTEAAETEEHDAEKDEMRSRIAELEKKLTESRAAHEAALEQAKRKAAESAAQKALDEAEKERLEAAVKAAKREAKKEKDAAVKEEQEKQAEKIKALEAALEGANAEQHRLAKQLELSDTASAKAMVYIKALQDNFNALFALLGDMPEEQQNKFKGAVLKLTAAMQKQAEE